VTGDEPSDGPPRTPEPRALRLFGLAEGVSYLLLIMVAMPLKYVMGVPEGVRYLGMAHGLVFVVYVAAVVRAARAGRWAADELIEGLAVAVLPLGPFLIPVGPAGPDTEETPP
jgi:integral membrane protein